MSKIAVIIDDWFEDSEYTEPVSEFRGKGHDIIHVGLEKGKNDLPGFIHAALEKLA